jgi:hypothetical protein
MNKRIGLLYKYLVVVQVVIHRDVKDNFLAITHGVKYMVVLIDDQIVLSCQMLFKLVVTGDLIGL